MEFRLFPLAALAIWLAPAAIATDAETARFPKALDELAQNSGLTVGIAIKDTVSGEEFLREADTEFPQGSAIRIHLIAELFRQAAANKLSLEEIRPLPESARAPGSGVLRFTGRGTVSMSLRDYATLVVTANDNSATNLITDLVGMDNVNASLAAQGTPAIKFRRRTPGPNAVRENVGTPRSVMRALELLHRGQVVDRATSDAIIEMLALPEVGYFRRELPRGVPFAGHSGSGVHSRCDAGIVLFRRNPYILCVMIKDIQHSHDANSDYKRADALIGAVTRLAHQHFSRLPGD